MANGKLITGRGGTPHLSHREQDAYYAALRGDLRLVDSDALTAKLGISSDYARRILHKLYRKGALDWLAKGQYAVVPPDVLFERRQRGVDPRPLLHALLERMGLAEGYYVAYQSAAQMHDAVHQVPFVFQVALTRQHRPLRLGNTEIRFIQVGERQIFGIEEWRYQGARLLLSDRERTILDLVDRPSIGGGIEEATRTIRNLLDGADSEKLARYAVRMGHHSTAQRLGYLLETTDASVIPEAWTILQHLRGRTVVPLEPGGASSGDVNRRWRVRVNASTEDTEW